MADFPAKSRTSHVRQTMPVAPRSSVAQALRATFPFTKSSTPSAGAVSRAPLIKKLI
jgi:hypothetical protein